MNKPDTRQFYEDGSYFEKGKAVFMDLNSPFQKYRVQKITDIYRPSADDVILDLGCGWGTFCFAFAPYCKEITGVDFSSKSIELCNEALKKAGLKNVRFVLADARATGLKDEDYEVIICADLLEHLYPGDCGMVLDECKRLIKSAGKLVIWTPNRAHFFEIVKAHNIILKKDPSHVDFKCMDYLLRELHKRDFLVLKAYYTESHIPVVRIIEKLFLRFVPFLRRRIVILAEKQ